ncbi:MAG: hypothetical protein WAV32_10305 [Halobacteriota archaeon]
MLDIRGTTDEGIPDYALWDMAQREERLLLSLGQPNGLDHWS